jgi:hypothetical protein
MKTCVFFFGGWQASDADVARWQGTAQKAGVQFFPYAWPSSVWSNANGDNAVEVLRKDKDRTFESMVKAVESSPAELIYLVGHSSGCAIANAVDAALTDHKKIQLVALDGFTPSQKQLDRPNTRVWGAVCDGNVSVHHDVSKARAKDKFRFYTATNCKTFWALHFSLVNLAANDTDVPSYKDGKFLRDGHLKGYVNCRANLVWMSL